MDAVDTFLTSGHCADYPLPTFARPVQVNGRTLYACNRCGLPRHMEDYHEESRKRRKDGTRYMVRRSVCIQCDAADKEVIRQRKHGTLDPGFVFPYREWGMKVDATGDVCPMCKEPNLRMCIDHIVPLRAGGTLVIENIQPICLGCNSRKWFSVERKIIGDRKRKPRKRPHP